MYYFRDFKCSFCRFYDGVRQLSMLDKETFARIDFDGDSYRRQLGVSKLSANAQQNVLRYEKQSCFYPNVLNSFF